MAYEQAGSPEPDATASGWEEMRAMVDEYERLLATLTDKLRPVLRPPGPELAVMESPPDLASPLCAGADQVRKHNRVLDELIGRVDL
jgi:hypothetical protein